jgi:predicted dehydrogenase
VYSSRVPFAIEIEHRLRVALVGCGGQAYRNILPSLHYAPVELVATCDALSGRAESYARQFGAPTWYDSYERLLEQEELDAVLLATGYDADGRPRYPVQAAQALASGRHVWIEKPPAASCAEIEALKAASRDACRQVGVGFMKMFTPTAAKLVAILADPDFGRPTTAYLRDPQGLPPLADRRDPREMVYFLDHIVHPVSLLHRLLGPIRHLYLEEGPGNEPIFTLKFHNGAAGVLHMPSGSAGTSPMERLEIVGEGANVVAENNTRIVYYRRGARGRGQFEYGRIPDFTTAEECAPLFWEIDGYSGQPFNMHIFYQGYANELIYFASRVLAGEPIEIGSLDDAWHVTRFFEACAEAPNQVVPVHPAPATAED